MRAKRTYTSEFRAAAVRLVLDRGLSQLEASRRLGIPKRSLNHWVAAAKHGQVKPARYEPTRTELQAENARLRRELARAEIECEIVKRAAAYFAREALHGAKFCGVGFRRSAEAFRDVV